MKKKSQKTLELEQKEEERLQDENFKKNLPILLLKLLAEASQLGISYCIYQRKIKLIGDDDIVIIIANERGLELPSDLKSLGGRYDITEFNYNRGTRYDFGNLEYIIQSVKDDIEEEKIRQEKYDAAKNKAKLLLTDEEREILHMFI